MNKVSVLIVNQALDHKGIIANSSFVLGLTAGRELADNTFGHDVVDGDNSIHRYLTKIGHFVRKAGQSKIRTLRSEFSILPEVLVVDYTEDAAPADYSEYENQIKMHSGEEIIYRAIYIYGPQDLVIPRTKNLSAL